MFWGFWTNLHNSGKRRPRCDLKFTRGSNWARLVNEESKVKIWGMTLVERKSFAITKIIWRAGTLKTSATCCCLLTQQEHSFVFIFIFFCSFVIAAVSPGRNLTDWFPVLIASGSSVNKNLSQQISFTPMRCTLIWFKEYFDADGRRCGGEGLLSDFPHNLSDAQPLLPLSVWMGEAPHVLWMYSQAGSDGSNKCKLLGENLQRSSIGKGWNLCVCFVLISIRPQMIVWTPRTSQTRTQIKSPVD